MKRTVQFYFIIALCYVCSCSIIDISGRNDILYYHPSYRHTLDINNSLLSDPDSIDPSILLLTFSLTSATYNFNTSNTLFAINMVYDYTLTIITHHYNHVLISKNSNITESNSIISKGYGFYDLIPGYYYINIYNNVNLNIQIYMTRSNPPLITNYTTYFNYTLYPNQNITFLKNSSNITVNYYVQHLDKNCNVKHYINVTNLLDNTFMVYSNFGSFIALGNSNDTYKYNIYTTNTNNNICRYILYLSSGVYINYYSTGTLFYENIQIYSRYLLLGREYNNSINNVILKGHSTIYQLHEPANFTSIDINDVTLIYNRIKMLIHNVYTSDTSLTLSTLKESYMFYDIPDSDYVGYTGVRLINRLIQDKIRYFDPIVGVRWIGDFPFLNLRLTQNFNSTFFLNVLLSPDNTPDMLSLYNTNGTGINISNYNGSDIIAIDQYNNSFTSSNFYFNECTNISFTDEVPQIICLSTQAIKSGVSINNGTLNISDLIGVYPGIYAINLSQSVIFFEGSYTSNLSVTTDNSSLIFTGGSHKLSGLTLNNGNIILNNARLNVSGCVNFSGTLIYNRGNDNLIEYTCHTGRFAKIIYNNTSEESSCGGVEYLYLSSSLKVVSNLCSETQNNMLYYIVIPTVSVIVIAAIIAVIVIYKNKKCRKKLFPYRDRQKYIHNVKH